MEVERHTCKELPEYISLVVEGQSFLSAFTKEKIEMFADMLLKYHYAFKKKPKPMNQTNQPIKRKTVKHVLACLKDAPLCVCSGEKLMWLSQIHTLMESKLKLDWLSKRKSKIHHKLFNCNWFCLYLLEVSDLPLTKQSFWVSGKHFCLDVKIIKRSIRW